ncbi:hypothetical protein GGI35DRAFT_449334 [Trichoderma velutinum]
MLDGSAAVLLGMLLVMWLGGSWRQKRLFSGHGAMIELGACDCSAGSVLFFSFAFHLMLSELPCREEKLYNMGVHSGDGTVADTRGR